MKSLAIVPVYLARPDDVQTLLGCVRSLRGTAGGSLDILLVDDRSPRPDLVDSVEEEGRDLKFELERKEVNSGFAKTVNVGLRRCLAEERDAVLVNQDIALRDNLHDDVWRPAGGSDVSSVSGQHCAAVRPARSGWVREWGIGVQSASLPGTRLRKSLLERPARSAPDGARV